MKNHIRCSECGRRRKPSHEAKCGTPKAYSEKCRKYEVVKKELEEIRKQKT